MKRFLFYITTFLIVFQSFAVSVIASEEDFTEEYVYDIWTDELVYNDHENFADENLQHLWNFGTYALGAVGFAPLAYAEGSAELLQQGVSTWMRDKVNSGELTKDDFGKIYYYKGEPYWYDSWGGHYWSLPKEVEQSIGSTRDYYDNPDLLREAIKANIRSRVPAAGWGRDAVKCFLRDVTWDGYTEDLWSWMMYCADNNVLTYQYGRYAHDPVWTDNKFHAYLNSKNNWVYYPGTGTSFQNHPWRMTKRTTYTSSGKSYYSYDLYYFVQSYNGSETQYRGQRGFVRQNSGRAYPTDGSGGWQGTIIANRYMPVGGVVGRPAFIPYGEIVHKPTKWPNLKGKHLRNHDNVLVSDLDNLINEAQDLSDDYVNSDPDRFDNSNNTEDGVPLVPDSVDIPGPIEQYDTPENIDGPIDPDPDPDPIIPSTIPLPTISNNGLPPITLDPLDLPDLEHLFPFCIPFDIYKGLKAVALIQGEPVWRIPIHIVIQDYTVVDDEIVIDLMQWNLTTIWSVIRGVILLAFIILLAIFTIRIVN